MLWQTALQTRVSNHEAGMFAICHRRVGSFNKTSKHSSYAKFLFLF